MPLRLGSLNIEGSKHFDKFIPFFKKADPDVICMQEVFSQDIPMLKREFGMDAAFAPITIRPYDASDMTSLSVMGVTVFSKLPFGSIEPVYYYGDPEMIPIYRRRDETRQYRPLLIVTLEKDGEKFIIGTTHFMVTENGVATDYQRRDLASLFKILDGLPEAIMCGDFNAPRGGEIFGKLAARFADNIPAEYATSIDGAIHRAGPIPFMVDGLFTTPHYTAQNVKLNSGLSDHMAITAEIFKA